MLSVRSRLLYHRSPDPSTPFRDVPTMTAIPEPILAPPAYDPALDPRAISPTSPIRVSEQGRIHRLDEITLHGHLRPVLRKRRYLGAGSPATPIPRSTGSRLSSPCPAASPRTTPSAASSACSTRRSSRSASTPGWRRWMQLPRIDPARLGPTRAEADRHRRQGSNAACRARHRRSIGPCTSPCCLGRRESSDPGASGHRRQIQRDYRDPRVARAADPQGAPW